MHDLNQVVKEYNYEDVFLIALFKVTLEGRVI